MGERLFFPFVLSPSLEKVLEKRLSSERKFVDRDVSEKGSLFLRMFQKIRAKFHVGFSVVLQKNTEIGERSLRKYI